ncbi:MAG: RES domain-containing protein [Candidatus Obscuribacterales bacterium]|nr:RES domain-containing protein [Candidatus Obscuribacterales bacterium]
MLGAVDLAAILAESAVQAYTRNVFRCVELNALLSYIPPQPLFDLGARITGQRFTPLGGSRALYVAEHPAMAYFETSQMFASVAVIAQQQAPPTVILNLTVHIESVLDLTVHETQVSLGTTIAELTANWQWQLAIGAVPPTHVLAELAFNSGRFQALRYPSALQSQQSNLIIWTERLTNPSFVQVIDPSGRFAHRVP